MLLNYFLNGVSKVFKATMDVTIKCLNWKSFQNASKSFQNASKSFQNALNELSFSILDLEVEVITRWSGIELT